MKKSIVWLALCLFTAVSVCMSSQVSSDLKASKVPQIGNVWVTDVNCASNGESSVVIGMPNNALYVLRRVFVYTDAITAVNTHAAIGVQVVMATNSAVVAATPIASTVLTGAATTKYYVFDATATGAATNSVVTSVASTQETNTIVSAVARTLGTNTLVYLDASSNVVTNVLVYVASVTPTSASKTWTDTVTPATGSVIPATPANLPIINGSTHDVKITITPSIQATGTKTDNKRLYLEFLSL